MNAEAQSVVDHFSARAGKYDRSSSWCTDDKLGDLVLRSARPRPADRVLDVACGTGLVSRLFAGRVAEVVGVDLTEAMAVQARPHLSRLHIGRAEALPFDDGEFDVVVCRQGIQFMDLPDAVREMARVTRPGGRVVLVDLCAYGEEDRDEYFEVLRLRNPVRRHFFLPTHPARLLESQGCDPVESHRYISVEDVDVWSDNGAIGEARREAIREVYRTASDDFRRLHSVRESHGRVVDNMLFMVTVGHKPRT
ncbi:methyltransferase domain-containing protein [Umezawaea sp. Da 62-37]|uniref:class I SAM-dependent methyltransferase n=1 Tax=Umezawaea sp. Da 62-37 TaxID=3075927 RepID=UPI0028F7185C|nr:methyltransferase domain-containing protein [Umezawaea sp. Da 62-37]WNV84996.1 methyltransferase domain-containing protein [Umezawaea sp. Da 62-37]